MVRKREVMKMTKSKIDISTPEEILAAIEKVLQEQPFKELPNSSGATHHSPHDDSDDYVEDDMDDIDDDAMELEYLLSEVTMYKRKEYHGPEKEHKTCIWPGGEPVSWTELSSGYTWIGINNGTGITCVVSLSDPIRKRPSGKTQISCVPILKGAKADMLGDTGFSFHPRIPQSFHGGPVAVVSVAPCLPGQEVQHPSRAINFLKEKLKDFSSLSSEETEQIAVRALKYLLGRKFNPNKIEIYGWGKYKGLEGRMSQTRVVQALKQIPTGDLTTSVSTISLSSTDHAKKQGI